MSPASFARAGLSTGFLIEGSQLVRRTGDIRLGRSAGEIGLMHLLGTEIASPQRNLVYMASKPMAIISTPWVKSYTWGSMPQPLQTKVHEAMYCFAILDKTYKNKTTLRNRSTGLHSEQVLGVLLHFQRAMFFLRRIMSLAIVYPSLSGAKFRQDSDHETFDAPTMNDWRNTN